MTLEEVLLEVGRLYLEKVELEKSVRLLTSENEVLRSAQKTKESTDETVLS